MQAGEAVLVGVHTDVAREWVDFAPGAVVAPWKQWPGMALSPLFGQAVQQAAADSQKLVLLWHSGVRSIAAAQRATQLGLEAHNILGGFGGFEGDRNPKAHRGQTGGWRHHGLPWRQH